MKRLFFAIPLFSLVACSPGFVPLSPNGNADVLQAKALACPDFTGEWKCTDDAGGKPYIESIKTVGNKYTIVSDLGLKYESTTEVVADGTTMSDSYSITGAAVAYYKNVAAKVGKHLPELAQIKLAQHIASQEGVTETNVVAKGAMTCADGKLLGDIKFQVKFAIPYVLGIEAEGTAKVEEKLVNGKRVSKAKLVGVAVGKSAVPVLKIDPLTQPLDSVQTTVCVRK